jgi:asparagine synthase (glutamine-hydrolysing)
MRGEHNRQPMGAIYGEVSAAPSVATGDRAIDVLAHRGRSGRWTWTADGIFVASRGPAPACHADRGRVAVLDGAILNARQLRGELSRRGHQVRGPADAEVVLCAFACWGADFLERVNGMFALAIWDSATRTLLLARDRMGERPLYYLDDGKRLLFASEIKAILAHETVTRRVDPRSLANFLTFAHTGSGATMFEGIRKLAPGHVLVAAERAPAVEPWWNLRLDERHGASDDELAEEVRGLLEDAVALRLPQGRAAGAFLSGGVDSSAVVALMQRHAGQPVKTFTLAYADGGAFDELAAARRTAEALGTEHHELRIGHLELLEHLRALVYHYDEPLGIAAGFNFYMLSRMAHGSVEVVLTGDGGDELFGGYRRHVAEQLAGPYQRLPDALARRVVPATLGRLPRLGRTRQLASVLPISDPALRTAAWLTVLTTQLRDELLTAPERSRSADFDPTAVYRSLYDDLGHRGDPLNRQLYAELRAWLPDTLFEKTDKPTMAHGIEARMPLFDHRLVELAFAISSRQKIRGLATKRVLRRAVKGIAPDHARRRAKHGFTIPVDPWFRGPLAPYVREVLLDERARTRGYFDPLAVTRLLDEHESGRRIWDRALWMLLNFELWHRVYLDGEAI